VVLPLLVQLCLFPLPRPELGQGDISRDAIQPRTQLANLGPRPQGLERPNERLLDSILGPLVTQKGPAVSKQISPVAQDDRGEGVVVALGGKVG
jgi:hypothetical protein